MDNLGTSRIKQKVKSISLVDRPQVKIIDLWNHVPGLKDEMEKFELAKNDDIIDAAEINIKYSGYISRERKLAEKIKRLEKIGIDPAIDYDSLMSISIEARQKLKRVDPRTIGQACRISGVSPADISVLLVHMGR